MWASLVVAPWPCQTTSQPPLLTDVTAGRRCRPSVAELTRNSPPFGEPARLYSRAKTPCELRSAASQETRKLPAASPVITGLPPGPELILISAPTALLFS